jgi:GT2 family glycosyltransferase
VDSGSTDGSPETARAAGATVVDLDMSVPFTAARARNAGLAALPPDAALVQLIDGDCILASDWLDKAAAFLAQNPQVGLVCGRRAERFPQASLYNRLADIEWDTPLGEARACGGDALARMAALRQVGGFRDDLIAGEEPEMCLRLRRAGWKIWRLDAAMTAHDAGMTRFSQWWRRSLRAGHAFAEGAALHGATPERHWVAETRRALLWGIVLPLAILGLGLLWPTGFLAALIYPAQVLRLAPRHGLAWALLTTLGKFAEAQGVLRYWAGRLRRRRAAIIEYK